MPQEPIHAAQAAASKLNIPYVTTNLSTAASHLTLSSVAEGSPDSVSQLVNDPSDVVLFLHTSGTTSRPKGVPLTQLNLASSVQNIKSVYKITEPDSTVIALPLFHVHGLIAGLLSSFSAGAAATLPAAVSLALRLLVVMKADEGFEVMEAGNSREEKNESGCDDEQYCKQLAKAIEESLEYSNSRSPAQQNQIDNDKIDQPDDVVLPVAAEGALGQSSSSQSHGTNIGNVAAEGSIGYDSLDSTVEVEKP
ncbi:hypothetical protein ACFX11_003178 [Malus domestica]